MGQEIGEKIKELRLSQKMTLKQLSEKTDLSIGYLSQLERGLTSVAISSLKSIANAFSVDLSFFFDPPVANENRILRSFEHKVSLVANSRFIYSNLGNDMECENISPFMITILPNHTNEELVPYSHSGEEFVYVLEGILTVFVDNERYELYPGDSIHIRSELKHNWDNHTSKLVKILCTYSPKILDLRENLKQKNHNI
ncbi:cupin domain-containing protein [Tissierella sp. MSJ-40]|uniref:Cupin domain-containing protein n=1 Tax=Tissierella simiarum TaxID=2841534 RepID=A0ABS6ED57_9FIRM|nr:cupin domain-containing protein [Tissierella simiarum]MBU5440169.1 cupin domain-containing protein [Tissierella simiarum]